MMEGKEQISIHVIQPNDMRDDTDQDEEDTEFNVRFDIRPFRHTFFRYSMYGKSEVVKASSIVYASHHQSEAEWLQINKLSVALVGNRIAPSLAFFAPTVKEIYFMGHISYPTTAFKMMEQMPSLKCVKFNLGLAGLVAEFHETVENLNEVTPEMRSVTSLAVVLNNNIFRSSPDNMKSVFVKVTTAVLKHSKDSFPNVEHLSIDIPNEPGLLERVIDLTTSNAALSSSHSIRVVGTHENINMIKVSQWIPDFRGISHPLNPASNDQAFAEQQFVQC